MDQLIELINSNIQYAPWIIFGGMLLAGLNIPVSEDLMLFTTAMLAVKNPDYMVPLFHALFWGAILSDIECYWLGRLLGPKLWKIKFFNKMISESKVKTISNYYHKYGIITLILGRFIPFGVRNGLFLTAGLGKMNFLKFAFSDFIACIISTTFFLYIYYTYGVKVIEYVKKGNVIILIVAILVVTFLVIRKKKLNKKLNIDSSKTV